MLPIAPQPNGSDSEDFWRERDTRSVAVGEHNCPRCNGQGYIKLAVPVSDQRFGKFLRCDRCGEKGRQERRAEIFEAQREKIQRYTSVRADQTFGSFSVRDVAPTIIEARAEALAYAESIASGGSTPRHGWLVMHGRPGTGKTHLANAVANRLIDEHWVVLGLTVPRLLNMLKSGFKDGSYDDLLELALNCGLLVLDDLGTESSTEWAYEQLFMVVDHRYSRALPTVFSFNGRVEDRDPRIASRLKDRSLSIVLPFAGQDYRERIR